MKPVQIFPGSQYSKASLQHMSGFRKAKVYPFDSTQRNEYLKFVDQSPKEVPMKMSELLERTL